MNVGRLEVEQNNELMCSIGFLNVLYLLRHYQLLKKMLFMQLVIQFWDLKKHVCITFQT